MLFHYAIIENVKLKFGFRTPQHTKRKTRWGFVFRNESPAIALDVKKEKKNQATRTIWGDNRLNISRLWNLSNLWNQRNLRNRYDEKKRNNNKYENTLTLFEILISGIKKITL